MLSRFAITFLPRSKCLLILWLQLPSVVILEPKKIKSVTASTFSPSIFLEVMGLDSMILVSLRNFFTLLFDPHQEAQWPDAASPPGALHLEPKPGCTLGLAVDLWAATCLEFQLSHLSCRSVGERLLTLSLKFLEMKKKKKKKESL